MDLNGMIGWKRKQ